MRTARVPAALSILVLGAVLGLIPARAETLVFATDGGFPPFVTLDEEGRPGGFERAVATVLCRRLGAECRFETAPFEALFTGLADGRFDVVFGGLTVSTIEAAGGRASRRHFVTAGRFVARIGSPAPARLDGLAGRTVGVIRGTPHAQWLDSAAGITVERYAEQTELYFALLAGRLDLVFGGGVAMWRDFLTVPAGERAIVTGPAVPGIEADGGGYAFALAPGSPVAGRLDAALAAMAADGALGALHVSHFPGLPPLGE